MKRVISLGISPRNVTLLLLAAAIAGAHALSATTLVVGTCKSGGYSTIQAAINAAPAGATVQVCPGYYYEQVKITKSVTLEGITASNSNLAVLLPPSGGLIPNATDILGRTVAAQVLVSNSPGPVSISNMYIDGAGNAISGCPPSIAGIFYQNSPGTVKGILTSNQASNGCGYGIWVEGGSSNPAVTVQNNNVSAFDYAGIYAETINQAYTELSAKITANSVYGYTNTFAGILLGQGSTSTVTNNVVIDFNLSSDQNGIVIFSDTAGSVSANTVAGHQVGIATFSDAVPVTSNTLFENYPKSIDLHISAGSVKNNFIASTAVAIEFNCFADPNVSNTINNAGVGVDQVPSGLTTANKYFNVTTIRKGGC